MQASRWFQLEHLFRKREFANLMAIYERNFRLLSDLAPGLAALPDHLVSHVDGSNDLHWQVLDRQRYTTELLLTHYLNVGDEHIADPDLRLRIYHDTRQVEMMCDVICDDLLEVLARNEIEPGVQARRWTVNLFLNRWLEYCLIQGHRFVAIELEGDCARAAKTPAT